ncbi:hypothetical protein [Limosilactobacillus kribbianus]|uniref:hypothetical protein n=1 Tax=Limosilactobacillus kribbianus TaxID=2982695 RepID=UPI002264DACC|nr:hypothetical protein [Limosilactobacillus kribbianus]
MTSNKIVDSPSARVTALADSFKSVLKRGQQYVDLLDQLAETNQANELLAAATALTKLDLSNAFIDFPQHYQAADYYMLFMGRLLEMHQVNAVKVNENGQHQFVATIDPLDDAVFKFEVGGNGEAAFTEQNQAQPLFYLNFNDRLFQFNNRALVNYFIVYALKKHSDLELRDAIKPLIKFANELADDLDFTINLGILNTANAERFKLREPDLKLTVIDRLFVRTAETDYMLMNLPHNSGAELLLDQGIKLDLSFDPDDYSQEWAFQVKDPGEQVSFFDILLHYNLVRQWYLNDRPALAVRSEEMVIAPDDDQADEAATVATEPATEEKPAETTDSSADDAVASENEESVDKED